MSGEKFLWYLKEDINEPWAWTVAFTPEECEQIIDIGNSLIKSDGDLYEGEINFDIRKSKVSWIPVNPDTAWIFARCTDMVNAINDQYFKFDLSYIESLQFTTYESPGDFYTKHLDIGYESGGTRKLSFSIQLAPPESYEGSRLLLHTGVTPAVGLTQQGAATIFPSYTLHEVTPITSGTRYSLVGWVIGPKFK